MLPALIVLLYSDLSPDLFTIKFIFDSSIDVHMAFWLLSPSLSLISLPLWNIPPFPTNYPYSWLLLYLWVWSGPFLWLLSLELSYQLNIKYTPKDNSSLFENPSVATSSAVRGKAPGAFSLSLDDTRQGLSYVGPMQETIAVASSWIQCWVTPRRWHCISFPYFPALLLQCSMSRKRAV